MAKDSDTTPLRVDAPFAKGYQAAPLIEPMDDFQEPSYQRQNQQQHHTYKGISSDAPPAVITWDKISYEVIVKTGKPFKKVAEKKVLLNNISGYAKPGELLAIMGATGAGKSTLLDVLAQRKNAGSLSGRLLVNGAVPDKFYKRLSAYVTQDDCLMGFQTVRETLKFYADLKLPSVLSQEARNRKVDEIIAELSLEKVRDSRVGTQFIRGISGGEKKRLSIGCQMITDPSLLFLDEPTTGLDAYNSLSVLESLKSLARSGKTVVCTIHQPRSTIFSLFDQMMVLSQARVAYFGQASEAVNYFSALGFHCGQFINPADFFIDITIENERTYNNKPLLSGASSSSSSSSHDPEAQKESRLGDLLGPQPHSSVNIVEAYEASEVHQRVRREVQEINAEYLRNRGKQQDARMLFTSEYASNFFKQFYFLSSRMLRNLFRNPMVTYAQLMQTIFMGLLVGSLYFDLGLSQGSIQNRVGCLFFMTTNQAFSTFASLNLCLFFLLFLIFSLLLDHLLDHSSFFHLDHLLFFFIIVIHLSLLIRKLTRGSNQTRKQFWRRETCSTERGQEERTQRVRISLPRVWWRHHCSFCFPSSSH